MATPRRMNGNQDLFGSDPFQPITKSFNVSISHSLPLSLSHFSPITKKTLTLHDVQEFNGLDFSNESRNNVKNLSALSFQTNRFEDDLSGKVDNEFQPNDSAKNPFLIQNESPKKLSSSLFHKSSEMMMGSGKSSKYDVFKNEIVVNGQVQAPVTVQQTNKSKTEASPDAFKDFAIAAFSEFKVDKTSLIHEFSNRLSDQRNHQNGKVIESTSCDRLCKCFSGNSTNT